MFLIASFLKKHSIKNSRKFSLCIPTRNSYSPPSFNIFHQTLIPLYSATWNLSENFPNINYQTLWLIMSDNQPFASFLIDNQPFASFLIKDSIKIFLIKSCWTIIRLIYWKKNSKYVCSKRRKTFSKTSSWFMVKTHMSDVQVHMSDIRVTYEWHTSILKINLCDF